MYSSGPHRSRQPEPRTPVVAHRGLSRVNDNVSPVPSHMKVRSGSHVTTSRHADPTVQRRLQNLESKTPYGIIQQKKRVQECEDQERFARNKINNDVDEWFTMFLDEFRPFQAVVHCAQDEANDRERLFRAEAEHRILLDEVLAVERTLFKQMIMPEANARKIMEDYHSSGLNELEEWFFLESQLAYVVQNESDNRRELYDKEAARSDELFGNEARVRRMRTKAGRERQHLFDEEFHEREAILAKEASRWARGTAAFEDGSMIIAEHRDERAEVEVELASCMTILRDEEAADRILMTENMREEAVLIAEAIHEREEERSMAYRAEADHRNKVEQRERDAWRAIVSYSVDSLAEVEEITEAKAQRRRDCLVYALDELRSIEHEEQQCFAELISLRNEEHEITLQIVQERREQREALFREATETMASLVRISDKKYRSMWSQYDSERDQRHEWINEKLAAREALFPEAVEDYKIILDMEQEDRQKIYDKMDEDEEALCQWLAAFNHRLNSVEAAEMQHRRDVELLEDERRLRMSSAMEEAHEIAYAAEASRVAFLDAEASKYYDELVHITAVEDEEFCALIQWHEIDAEAAEARAHIRERGELCQEESSRRSAIAHAAIIGFEPFQLALAQTIKSAQLEFQSAWAVAFVEFDAEHNKDVHALFESMSDGYRQLQWEFDHGIEVVRQVEAERVAAELRAKEVYLEEEARLYDEEEEPLPFEDPDDAVRVSMNLAVHKSRASVILRASLLADELHLSLEQLENLDDDTIAAMIDFVEFHRKKRDDSFDANSVASEELKNSEEGLRKAREKHRYAKEQVSEANGMLERAEADQMEKRENEKQLYQRAVDNRQRARARAKQAKRELANQKEINAKLKDIVHGSWGRK